jgi:glucosamine-6-phosphate deaminase
MDTLQIENMQVSVSPSRLELGRTAAAAIAEELRAVIARKGGANVVFASAPSQNETLAALVEQPGIEWERVTGFHMDEYVGLDANHPASFRRYQREHLLSHVNLKEFNWIGGDAPHLETEIARYTTLMRDFPADLCLAGIGENGHIAFNDPPVCDFDDPVGMKVVRLDQICRQQQVNDGMFPGIDDVPTHALTLTVPQLVRIPKLFVMVPGPTKRNAVRETLEAPVSTACPATILRQHPGAVLYVDRDSYGG